MIKVILIQYDQCPYEKRKLGHKHIQREDHVKTQEKIIIYKPRRDASKEAIPANTMISDFDPSEL